MITTKVQLSKQGDVVALAGVSQKSQIIVLKRCESIAIH